jgi:L-asparagine transporter-like permease
LSSSARRYLLADRGDAPQSLVKLNARRVPEGSVLMGAAAGFLGIIAATHYGSTLKVTPWANGSV